MFDGFSSVTQKKMFKINTAIRGWDHHPNVSRIENKKQFENIGHLLFFVIFPPL